MTAPPDAAPVLVLRGVTKRFGAITANDGISLELRRGEVLALLGENGAGKSTLVSILFGHYVADAGTIEAFGQPLPPGDPAAALRAGIGMVHQHFTLADNLTVLDNVMVGHHSRTRGGFLANALRLPRAAREDRAARDKALSLIAVLGLEAHAATAVADLPFGTQKRVELARALAAEPKLLLLDEPASGLNHEEVEALGDLVQELRSRFALTVLLVEHHMGLVMRISDRVVALNFGRVIAEGTPDEVKRHPEVVRAYLGT